MDIVDGKIGAFVLTLLLGLGALTPATVCAGGSITYKYQEKDGTVWFTDRKPNADRLKDFELLGYHGRPPARSSCRDLGDNEIAQRAKRIATPIHHLARQYDVDYRLIKAIVSVESCFDPKAVSRVGARGLMQLMPATAARLGVKDAFDISQNLRAGVQFFTRMHRRFDGNTVYALAAYNAGPTAVERNDGIPPYPETERYVRRVLDRWQDYRNATDLAGSN